MIPACVAAIAATRVVPLDHAATGLDVCLVLEPDGLLAAVAVLDREEYLLEDVTAADLAEGFEVRYHFSLPTGPTRIALRLAVPREAPQVPSIAGIFPGADWHERECADFFGIVFVGHPNPHPLLLPEDFEGHPLVKAPKARRSLAELLPPDALAAWGLAEPATPEAEGREE